MASFDKALAFTLKIEKDIFTVNPNDRGGATRLGITIKTLNAWHIKNGWPLATEQDVQNLTVATVTPIYDDFFWAPLMLGEIDNDSTATAIFDFGVNAGIGHSAQAAQRVVHAPEIDGIIGKMTQVRLNAMDHRQFLCGFIMQIHAYYFEIVRHDATQLNNLHGWINRSDLYLPMML